MSSRLRNASSSFAEAIMATTREWSEHRTIRLGAGLAYYGLFALIPVLSVSLSIASIFFAREGVQDYLSNQLLELFGDDAASIGAAVADLLDETGSVVGLGIVGVASLFFAASLLVVALQDALNTIWVRPVRTGIRHTVARRLFAFVVVAASGGLLVVSFALNGVSALFEQIVPNVAIAESVGEVVGVAVSWALGIGVIALLFRYLPDVRVPWRSVLPGAVVTAFGVAIGTVAIGAYLRRYAATSLLGATGSIFLILIWIYYEAQIILAGAELTRVLSGDATREASAGDDRETGVGPGDDAAVDVGG
jgi:membrane protein